MPDPPGCQRASSSNTRGWRPYRAARESGGKNNENVYGRWRLAGSREKPELICEAVAREPSAGEPSVLRAIHEFDQSVADKCAFNGSFAKLDFSKQPVGDCALRELVRVLLARRMSIEKLDLSWANIGAAGAQALGHLITNAPYPPMEIDLTENYLAPEPVRDLLLAAAGCEAYPRAAESAGAARPLVLRVQWQRAAWPTLAEIADVAAKKVAGARMAVLVEQEMQRRRARALPRTWARGSPSLLRVQELEDNGEPTRGGPLVVLPDFWMQRRVCELQGSAPYAARLAERDRGWAAWKALDGGCMGRKAERDRLDSISRAVCVVLRHGRPNRLALSQEGYASIGDLLQLRQLQELSCSSEDVRRIVQRGGWKKRFELAPGGEHIRAAQGHSRKDVVTQCAHRRLSRADADLPKLCAHGTFWRCWDSIRCEGLRPGGLQGTRNEVHFATERRGIRSGAEIVVYLDLGRALADGLPLFVSSAGVVLSSETIHPWYFLKAVDVQADPPVVLMQSPL